ncbi:MAG: hypothetical protein AAGC95_09345 [Pseudomonadota bacterium]
MKVFLERQSFPPLSAPSILGVGVEVLDLKQTKAHLHSNNIAYVEAEGGVIVPPLSMLGASIVFMLQGVRASLESLTS